MLLTLGDVTGARTQLERALQGTLELTRACRTPPWWTPLHGEQMCRIGRRMYHIGQIFVSRDPGLDAEGSDLPMRVEVWRRPLWGSPRLVGRELRLSLDDSGKCTLYPARHNREWHAVNLESDHRGHSFRPTICSRLH